jgi:peptide/nickel transport system permease protein
MTAAYLLRRLAAVLVVLLIVSLTVFAITQVLPGNAAVMILGENATADQLRAVELQLGLDRPLHVQFGSWLGAMLHGDWGQSMRLSVPVASLIADAFWRSAALAGAALPWGSSRPCAAARSSTSALASSPILERRSPSS